MKRVVLVLTFLAVSLFAKIDINKATVEDFASIKGIGDKKAVAIVKYRKANGKFKSYDDLEKVKGIGPSLVENIKNDIKDGDKSAKKAKKKGTKKASAKKSSAKKATDKKSSAKKTAKTKKTDGKKSKKTKKTKKKSSKKSTAKKEKKSKK